MLFSNNILCEAGGQRPEAGGGRPLVVYDATRFINIHKVLVDSSKSTSTVVVMVSSLGVHLVVLGSILGWGGYLQKIKLSFYKCRE